MNPYRYRHAALALLLAAVVAVAPLAAQQAKRQVKQYTIEQFLNTTSVFGSSFSPDENEVIFSSNKTGIFNVWKVPAAGGEARQVTQSTKESTYSVSYFPLDGRILYTYDRGGNENNHLYLLDKDGQEKDLTPGEKTKAQFYGWSQDGKTFFFGTNERDARFFDVYKMDAAKLERSLLFQNDEGYQVGEISGDGRYLALVKVNGEHDSDIYLFDASTKQTKHITPHEGWVQHSPEDFHPARPELYITTNAGSEFAYVARYDLDSGKLEPVEKHDWDVMYTRFSHNGKYRVTAVNQDARTKIILYETATGKPIELPRLGEGDITGVNISRSEKKMAFYFNGDRSPSDLHVYDFGARRVTKLSNSLNPEIDPEDLVEGEVVRFKSFDGMMIPAILYRPHQASADHKLPAIVQVHGGPGGQQRKGYAGIYQYLVNHGYTVLYVNNRGSSGYGKTFFAADDRKHGREPLWDCVEAKKYLASLPGVDRERIGILGGSYGGYMVLAALAFQPDVFDVGVNIFGVSNWLRTLKSIPPYWESFRKALYGEIGDPEKDEAFLRETSPLFHADKIKKPMIVLQGANDPRVIKPESDDIVTAVKKNGVPVEYVVFDNEGHGFTKKENQVRGYKAILDFLDKHLKNKGGDAKAAE